jgi:hypothetical protein
MTQFESHAIAASVFSAIVLPSAYAIFGDLDWRILWFTGIVLLAFIVGRGVKDLLCEIENKGGSHDQT